MPTSLASSTGPQTPQGERELLLKRETEHLWLRQLTPSNTPSARLKQVRGHCVKPLSALQFRFPHSETIVGFQLARQQTPHPAPHLRRLKLVRACPKVVFFPLDFPDSGLIFAGISGSTETKFVEALASTEARQT